jgi:hypothetical protein
MLSLLGVGGAGLVPRPTKRLRQVGRALGSGVARVLKRRGEPVLLDSKFGDARLPYRIYAILQLTYHPKVLMIF